MKKIELFIHTKEHIQKDTQPLEHIKSVRNRRAIGGYNEQLITSVYEWLPADEIRVKKLVEEFASSQNLKFIVYDRARFWDGLKAKFKGIKTTPTVILGKHRFTADITQDSLKEAL